MTEQSISELADRFFAAIEAGDVDTVRDLYAPDAVVWHNTDGVAQGRDENLATLAWMAANLSGVRYTEIRRAATERGFVQQHVLRATNRAGRVVEVPACLVFEVRDELVGRIDEYLDSAAVAAILER